MSLLPSVLLGRELRGGMGQGGGGSSPKSPSRPIFSLPNTLTISL